MSQVWSEINKVVNVLDLKEQVATTGLAIPSDIVHLENYKQLTFLITLGPVAAANKPTVTVCAGMTATAATTTIPFKYREQIDGTGGSTGDALSDIPSELKTSTGNGFTFTTGDNGGMYIVEVDPSVVAAQTSTGTPFDHVKLLITNAGTTSVATQLYGVTAILSEPRYPQAILQTAID